MFEIDVAEFFHREVTALGGFEFIQPLLKGCLGNFGYIHHLSGRSPEVVHASSQNESSTTYARRSASRRHPIPVETLDDPNGIIGDSHGVRAKLEAVGKPKDQVLGIDGMNGEAVPVDAEFVNQSFVDMTQSEDIELQ